MEGYLPNTLEVIKEVTPDINPNGMSTITYCYMVLSKYKNMAEVYKLVSKGIQDNCSFGFYNVKYTITVLPCDRQGYAPTKIRVLFKWRVGSQEFTLLSGLGTTKSTEEFNIQSNKLGKYDSSGLITFKGFTRDLEQAIKGGRRVVTSVSIKQLHVDENNCVASFYACCSKNNNQLRRFYRSFPAKLQNKGYRVELVFGNGNMFTDNAHYYTIQYNLAQKALLIKVNGCTY